MISVLTDLSDGEVFSVSGPRYVISLLMGSIGVLANSDENCFLRLWHRAILPYFSTSGRLSTATACVPLLLPASIAPGDLPDILSCVAMASHRVARQEGFFVVYIRCPMSLVGGSPSRRSPARVCHPFTADDCQQEISKRKV
jgi:hypothetical protein